MVSQADCIYNFKHSTGARQASNMYWKDGTVLYSYGSHFPMLVRTHAGIIMNADKYSITTSCQQSKCFSTADFQLPFSALTGIFPNIYTEPVRCLNQLELLDKTVERWDTIGWKHILDDKKRISVKEYLSLLDTDQQHYKPIEERRPESVLLQIKSRLYLSSMDDNQYFICELPAHCETTDRAFELLKPNACKGKAEDVDYIRQGEWFFVDITEYIDCKSKRKVYDSMVSDFVLPRSNERSNPHTATKGALAIDYALKKKPPIKGFNAAVCIVSGAVKHPEHRQLRLSTGGKVANIKFFAAFENTAVNSWSASENVD